MAYEDLKLIKCFRFDKDEKHWDMCDEWMSKYRVEVGALHTFAHGKNEAYIATTRYSADGESDGIDSKSHNRLRVCVMPIAPEDAENEEKVKELADNGNETYTRSFDTHINFHDEEYYTKSILWPVFQAIDGYKSSKKKKTIQEQAEKGEISVCPNAVKVYKEDYEPDPITIRNFASEAALAKAWYLGEPCSSVGINPMGEDSTKLLGIDRQLCYFYPLAGSFGRPSVGAYIRHDGKKCINVYFSNWWDTGNSAVICAYVKGKPASLTEAEVQKILDFVKDDAK